MSLCFYRYLELYEWELSTLPFSDSVVGRHIYVCVARSVLRQKYFQADDLSIKSLLSSSLFSDRAVRIKIREMESRGYLHFQFSKNDKRVRILRPTDKLLHLIDAHSTMFFQSINQDHHLIQR